MKYKKIMLITLLLLAVLTIGAVSAADDVASDDLAASDDVGVIAEDGDDSDGDDSDDDETPDDEDEREGDLYIDEDHILVDYDREVVGLDTGGERDTGRLVVFDTDTSEEYFNSTLADMRYNTDWMKYKFNAYDGYYVFPADLDVKSGVYDINATYYNDDNTINETVIGTVIIDKDSFIEVREIDINDDTTVVVSTYIFDWFDDGYIVIGYLDEDENTVIVNKYAITPADLGTVRNYTLADLNLGVGDYDGFFAAYLPDGGDIDEDLEGIVEEDVSIVDNTKFRASIAEEFASILYKDEIFFVYFPATSAGTNITIYVDETPVITHLIAENETGDYYGFTLNQLKISKVDEYSFAVYDNNTGDVLFENYTYDFDNPIEFSDVCVLNSSADVLLELTTPMNFTEGRIEIIDENMETVFEKNLAEIEPDTLGWDVYFQRYVIPISNLTKQYAAGTHTFSTHYINGEFTLSEIANVRIVERKYVENDNASIEIFDYVIFDLNDIDDGADSIAQVIADNNGGRVVIWIGDEWNITLNNPEYENDEDIVGWVYTLSAEELIYDLDEGNYPINVTYYNADGEEVLNLTSAIDIIRGKASAEIGEYAYDVLMKGDWNATTRFVIVRALDGFEGTVAISLDDDKFEISLDKLMPYSDIENPLFCDYYIYFDDLDGMDYEAREYVVCIAIYDDDDERIWDNGDGDTIRFYKAQIAQNDNVTIEILPTPTIIPDEAFILINASDNTANVTIYVGDSEEAINIPLNECEYADGYYIIGTDKLEFCVGEYDLNVTYQGLSLEGHVILVSNLAIEMPNEEETQYWGYGQDPIIAKFSLRNGDIEHDPVSGNVTVFVYFDGETPTLCFEDDISELEWHGAMQGLLLRLSDLKGYSNLTGTYKVEVVYKGGSEAATGDEHSLTFKELSADDFSVEIVGDSIIFSIPDNIFGDVNITIDGKSEVKDIFDLGWDEDEKVYYLEVEGLSSGTHQVSVAFNGKEDSQVLEIASTVVNPIDPALTITIANIEEGSAANVVITTDAAFSGNVTVKIGTANYTVSVVNGKGTLPITGLAANTYNATAIFAATGLFAASEKTTTFTVSKKAPVVPPKQPDKIKLTLKKVKVKKSAKKLVLKATLKINGKAVKGKVIKFKFKGKTYKAKTNKKGIAKVTIKKKVLKKLKVGKKVKYQATYGKVTKKYTVKVKK